MYSNNSADSFHSDRPSRTKDPNRRVAHCIASCRKTKATAARSRNWREFPGGHNWRARYDDGMLVVARTEPYLAVGMHVDFRVP